MTTPRTTRTDSLAQDLRKALQRKTGTPLASPFAPYQPLLGIWLLQLALLLGWHSSGSRDSILSLFEDEDFMALTGLALANDGDDGRDDWLRDSRRSAPKARDRELGRRLEQRLAEWQRDPRLAELTDLPLFTNCALLCRLVGADRAGEAVLLFAAAIALFPPFRAAIAPRCEKTSDQNLARMIAHLTGQKPAAVQAALRPESPLLATGIVLLQPGIRDLEDKLVLLEALAGPLLTPQLDEDTLSDHFLKRVSPAQLPLTAFPHLRRDIAALGHYLKAATETGALGVNVLFYGASGTGKTELAKALAAGLGLNLYEIACADEHGDPLRGESRLQAYNLGQKLLARRENALLLFDEIEDVFPAAERFWPFFEDTVPRGAQGGGKAWINRTLERNPVPALWVTNDARLDPAYLRRFGYSVHFPVPPQPVRVAIVRHHFAGFQPDEGWLGRIAASDQRSPGQLERAAAFAALAGGSDHARALELAALNLERSDVLLGQAALPARNPCPTGYDLSYLNIDLDVTRLIAGLSRRPAGSFCFYGPPGTGKSELARYIADALGLPALVRRASDLLSKWVGESEQNLAALFAEARQQEAVLILDEADSLLGERTGAFHSWEVTRVNELLTQMEAHSGILIVTTNLMERLDQASLRRFVAKVRFDYLTAAQSRALFRQELARAGGDPATAGPFEAELDQLDRLTPGDFAVAARRFALLGEPATAAELLDILRQECAAKAGIGRRIGFVP